VFDNGTAALAVVRAVVSAAVSRHTSCARTWSGGYGDWQPSSCFTLVRCLQSIGDGVALANLLNLAAVRHTSGTHAQHHREYITVLVTHMDPAIPTCLLQTQGSLGRSITGKALAEAASVSKQECWCMPIYLTLYLLSVRAAAVDMCQLLLSNADCSCCVTKMCHNDVTHCKMLPWVLSDLSPPPGGT
jgi:hypothetical protein